MKIYFLTTGEETAKSYWGKFKGCVTMKFYRVTLSCQMTGSTDYVSWVKRVLGKMCLG